MLDDLAFSTECVSYVPHCTGSSGRSLAVRFSGDYQFCPSSLKLNLQQHDLKEASLSMEALGRFLLEIAATRVLKVDGCHCPGRHSGMLHDDAYT